MGFAVTASEFVLFCSDKECASWIMGFGFTRSSHVAMYCPMSPVFVSIYCLFGYLIQKLRAGMPDALSFHYSLRVWNATRQVRQKRVRPSLHEIERREDVFEVLHIQHRGRDSSAE